MLEMCPHLRVSEALKGGHFRIAIDRFYHRDFFERPWRGGVREKR